MGHNQEIGKFGETLAKNYLIKRGYKIIGQNMKISYQELDLITEKDGVFVFVEVKTRVSQVYGPADEAAGFTKLARFKKGIEMFLDDYNIVADNFRADLIAVDIDREKSTAKIKHYKDVL